MKRYILIASGVEAEARRLFDAGEGEVGNWEVLERLMKLLTKADEDAVFTRHDPAGGMVLDMDIMECCLERGWEVRPKDGEAVMRESKP